ncbi:hypothetical protein RND81_03G075100 [Saponaria officinalis]|uniref:DUF4371 domain-containing protein n=1 Tax=Saponaria officinalis TaxID=3572 RepID=A0AAW1M1X7_SAPOF
MCENLMNEKPSIRSVLDKQSRKEKSDYRTRLNASIDCTRLLLSKGMAFRGHNEHEFSRNKGNFIEVLEWYSTQVDKVAHVMLKNAPKNLKLTFPEIQKDIVKAVATATVERAFSAINFIENDLRNKMGDDFLNDCMVTYIEKDVFASLSNDGIMRRFQNMKSRRQQLY